VKNLVGNGRIKASYAVSRVHVSEFRNLRKLLEANILRQKVFCEDATFGSSGFCDIPTNTVFFVLAASDIVIVRLSIQAFVSGEFLSLILLSLTALRWGLSAAL